MTAADRGTLGHGYTVVTPSNHYPSRLPEFGDQPVIKLVTPRMAPARIGQYLVTLAPGGGTTRRVGAGYERFFYVLDGSVTLLTSAAPDGRWTLRAGGYAYLPSDMAYELRSTEGARLLIVKRLYEGHAAHDAPAALSGHRDDEPFAATPVSGFTRRELLPVDDPAFDFAMSLLRFDAGIGLDNIEVHDEEHGLWMTEGAGVYVLNGNEHPVQAKDFIYMAPYCPQGFTAGADGPAEYLLYKDTWRDGF
jgi:(S)-ureidoglycine aminohydrolase